MARKLSVEEITGLLSELRQGVEKDECWPCDCLQGFITRLELDAVQEARELIEPLKVSRSQMHG